MEIIFVKCCLQYSCLNDLIVPWSSGWRTLLHLWEKTQVTGSLCDLCRERMSSTVIMKTNTFLFFLHRGVHCFSLVHTLC